MRRSRSQLGFRARAGDALRSVQFGNRKELRLEIENASEVARCAIDEIYRAESRRVFATLVRLLGDFDLAEDGLHEAFRAALELWPVRGVPENPRTWLVSTGRFKAIDMLRRRARFEALEDIDQWAENAGEATGPPELAEDAMLEDDRLRLIFTCCHPALSSEAQVALTLREVCGLTTEEIARAFLMPAPTLAQRIVRAKAKIRDARIPYQVPGPEEWPNRLDAVLRTIYLVFNEGYSASAGETVTRRELTAEAIRLGRLLVELRPEAETLGLLALMLLHDARRDARISTAGDPILLPDQDRTRWDREQIAEGSALAERALKTRAWGPYSLQGAIAAVHGEATDGKATDWAQIVELYNVLAGIDPSPVVALNRAAAIAMRDGPAAGLLQIETILARKELTDYAPAHIACAELQRKLGQMAKARASYQRALALVNQEPERRFLQGRLRGLQDS